MLIKWLDKCHFGDCLDTMRKMPSGCVNTCVTSPPYFGLRDYGHAGQIGLEGTPDEFIDKLVDVFREVKRVLCDNGTLWVNIGDSYCAPNGRSSTGKAYNMGPNSELSHLTGRQNVGIKRGFGDAKPKDLIGIPWLLAFALRSDGWYLRQEIIWHKPNPMPESVTDRCTKSHESIFLLAKSEKYYFDSGAICEKSIGGTPGNVTHKGKTAYELGDDLMRTKQGLTEIGARETRNKRSVWTVATTPYKGAHFATFPPALIEPCILAGVPAGGVVLDPFFGSGTTGQVAQALGRHYIGCELNPAYKPLQDDRTAQPSLIMESAEC